MSDPEPRRQPNPFEGLGVFGDLARLLGNQGPLHWDAARQMALMLASEGDVNPNVEPLVRIRWEELGRIAEMHVSNVTGLDTTVGGRAAVITPVTPVAWADGTLTAYRPLFERLAGALHGHTLTPPPGASPRSGAPPSPRLDEQMTDIDAFDDDDDDDSGEAMLAGLFQLLGPSLLGMSAGSMIGHLSRRNFGSYDLPIPRPLSSDLLVIDDNVRRFTDDWSLPEDDVRLWVCLSELTHHAVLAVPHVRAAMEDLLGRFVAGFRPQSDGLVERLSDIDADPGRPDELQRLFSDPQLLLGAMASPEQLSLVPSLDALVAVVIGYVDHTVDDASRGLISSAGRIGEAVRRRRVEASQADHFVERLFGLSLSRQQVERGHAFVDGVLKRAPDGLNRLWRDADALPTPNEVDAPGLWLARLEL